MLPVWLKSILGRLLTTESPVWSKSIADRLLTTKCPVVLIGNQYTGW